MERSVIRGGVKVAGARPRVVPWDRDAVQRRLRHAIKTAAKMPDRELRLVRGDGVAWPEIVLEFADKVGRKAVNRRTVTRPAARDIADMDEALQWVLWIDNVEARTIVMARAAGADWRKIMRELSIGRTWAWMKFVAGLDLIVDRLNGAAPRG